MSVSVSAAARDQTKEAGPGAFLHVGPLDVNASEIVGDGPERLTELSAAIEGKGASLVDGLERQSIVAGHRVLDGRTNHALDVLLADLRLLVVPGDDDPHPVFA